MLQTTPGKVYKGICLQCNTLQHAKELLGEADPSSSVRADPSSTIRAASSNLNDATGRTHRRAASSNPDDTAGRTHRRAASHEVTNTIEDEHGTVEQHGVPRNVGPRMGGLQKQLSDITLDSTMRDLEIDPQKSSTDRNFNSLDNIVEDESSHNRDGLRVPASTGNIESRPGVFPLEGGAMERLEARIRAKSDVSAAETTNHHVHFKYKPKSPGGDGIDEEPDIIAQQPSRHKLSTSLTTSEVSGNDRTHAGIGMSFTDGSGNQASLPGTAVNMTGDRLNIYEQRIRRKNAQPLNTKTHTAGEKNKIQSDFLSHSEHSNESDKRKGGEHGLSRMKTDSSGTQDSLPGTAVNMTGDRLNIYEERIRRKHAHPLIDKRRSSSLEKDASSSENKATKSDLLSQSDRSGYNDTVSRGLQRTITNDSAAQYSIPGTAVSMTGDRLNIYEQRVRGKNDRFSSDNKATKSDLLSQSDRSGYNDAVDRGLQRTITNDSAAQYSIPGTAVSMTGDRLNIYEQRIRRKNDRFHHSLTEQPTHDLKLSQRAASERALPPVTEDDSKPGVLNIQGDLLNLYERRINQKSKQFRQSDDGKQGQSEGSHSNSEQSEGSGLKSPGQVDSSFDISRTYEPVASSSKPGISNVDASDRNNLFTKRIQEKSQQNSSSGSSQLKAEAIGDKSASFSPESSMEIHPSKPGAFPETSQDGRLNVFEQRIREKKASSDRDSDYSKVLEKKIRGGNSEATRKRNQHHIGETEHVAELDAKTELSEIKASGSCDDIIGFLRLHSNTLAPAMIVYSFECIREILTTNYASPEKPHLFRSKVSWLKLFSSLMYTHFSDELVQTEALKTLWSIASYSSKHADDINANDEIIESIVDSMEAHQSEDVNEFGSGLIGRLALLEKDALSLLERCDGQIVLRLVSALTSSSCTGASYLNAIKALTRLSSVYHQNRVGSFGDWMGRDIKDERIGDCSSAKSICAVLDAMHQHTNHVLLQTEGSKLLCQLFVRDAILDDESYAAIVNGMLNRIESTFTVQMNAGLAKALIYLLSSISTFSSESIVEDEFSFSGEVLNIMSSYPDEATIALHGCRFIYNVCSGGPENNTRSVIGVFGGISIILKCMSSFERDIEIVGEACGALFACCCDCPSNKKVVLDLGGVDAIGNHAFNADLDLEDDEVLSLNIRACAGRACQFLEAVLIPCC